MDVFGKSKIQLGQCSTYLLNKQFHSLAQEALRVIPYPGPSVGPTLRLPASTDGPLAGITKPYVSTSSPHIHYGTQCMGFSPQHSTMTPLIKVTSDLPVTKSKTRDFHAFSFWILCDSYHC